MLKWLHHLLNPHCPDCLADKLRREEKQETKEVCKSCEVLQYEVERLRADNDKLLTRILAVPDPVQERLIAPEPTSKLPPRVNTWAVRRQLLEQESRERARVLKQAPQPTTTSTEQLEQELDIAATQREAEGTK